MYSSLPTFHDPRGHLMKSLLLPLLLIATTASAQSTPPAHQHGAEMQVPPPNGASVIDIPPVDVGAQTLEARAAAERSDAAKLTVPHDFRFTDRLPESGITFVHQ